MFAVTDSVVVAVAVFVTVVFPESETETAFVFVEPLPVVLFEVLLVTLVVLVPVVPEPLFAEFATVEDVATLPVVRLPPVVFCVWLLPPVFAATVDVVDSAAVFVVVEFPLELMLVAFVFVESAPVSWFDDVLLAVIDDPLPIDELLFAALLIALPDNTPPVIMLPAVVFWLWVLLPVLADKPNELSSWAVFTSVMSPLTATDAEFVLSESNPVVLFMNVPPSEMSPCPMRDVPILTTEFQFVVPAIVPEWREPPVVFMFWILFPVAMRALAIFAAVAKFISVRVPLSLIPYAFVFVEEAPVRSLVPVTDTVVDANAGVAARSRESADALIRARKDMFMCVLLTSLRCIRLHTAQDSENGALAPANCVKKPKKPGMLELNGFAGCQKRCAEAAFAELSLAVLLSVCSGRTVCSVADTTILSV